MPVHQTIERNYLPYCSIGGTGFLIVPICPELAVGCRRLNSHHSWDINGGGNMMGSVFAQASYLYYQEPSKGLYVGVGVTGGFFVKQQAASFLPAPPRYYANLPITIGHQWDKSFVQFQITPLATTTVSYGIGF